MQKQTNGNKSSKLGQTAQLQPVIPPVVAPTRARRSRRAAIVMIVVCLLLAMAAVLMAPMLASGASTTSVAPSATPAAEAPAVQKAEYQSLEEAQQAAGFAAVLPTALPEGTQTAAIRVVDGAVLEIEYKVGKNVVWYRTAPGSDDISADNREHTFTTTEEVDGVVRGYAGVTEEKLNLAVWSDGEYCYAIVAEGSMDADVMKSIAQSVG